MQKLVRPYIDDILEAIDQIEAVVGGKTFEEYTKDWMLTYAVERAIEIISEASRRIPNSLRDQRPEIPWRKITGIGNVLRHEYRRVADEAIYRVATQELAALKVAILAIEANLDEPEE